MTNSTESRSYPSYAVAPPPRPMYPADLVEFVQDASIGVLILGGDGIVRWANQAEYGRLGFKRDDFFGKPYAKFFADMEEGEDVMNRLYAGEVLTACVVGLRHASGERLTVAIDGHAVRRDDDWHARLLTRDLTAERRSSEETRLQAAMLDAVGQAILCADIDGLITYWNSAAEKLYGWKADEALGRPVFELIVPEKERARAQEIVDLVAAGNTWSGEFPLVRRDGSEIDAFITDTPLLDDKGKLAGFVGVAADMTSLKTAEREARVRQRRLEALAESLPAIVAMASQDDGFYYFNRTWTDFTGASTEPGVINWAELIHEDDFDFIR
ncbi:MAG TPA: PAS domain S-box protein, partial [Dehalococcoidia bacterium]